MYVPVSNEMMLVGTGHHSIVWHLTKYTVDQVDQQLSYAQKKYVKVYYQNGSFISSDGFVGEWNLPTNNSLSETVTNLPSGTTTTQVYTILSLTYSQLILQYTYNGSQIITTYTAGY